MTNEEAFEKVNEALQKATNGSATAESGKHLIEDNILDSLDTIAFLFELEEVTSIKIPEVAVDEYNLMDIDNLCEYIQKNSKSET